MSKNKLVYLSGFLSVFFSVILLLAWIFLSFPGLIWFNLVVYPVLFFGVVMIALYVVSAHLKQRAAVPSAKYSYPHLIGHTFVIALALAVSLQCFNFFRQEAGSHLKAEYQHTVEVSVKNISGRDVKDFYIDLGDQHEKITLLKNKETKTFRFIFREQEAELTAYIGNTADTAMRQTQIWLDKSIRQVFLNVDLQQNILPETRIQ